eukprot:gene25024-15659_t
MAVDLEDMRERLSSAEAAADEDLDRLPRSLDTARDAEVAADLAAASAEAAAAAAKGEQLARERAVWGS